jgi:hypothetical protein
VDTPVFEETELEMKLADSEAKFKVLTELNPVGMYYLSPDGGILYCNDMCELFALRSWSNCAHLIIGYEITGHPRGLEGEMSFMNVLSEVDHPMVSCGAGNTLKPCFLLKLHLASQQLKHSTSEVNDANFLA